MKTAIDPITLEIIKNALNATADEMALVVMRTAYSQLVRDTMDYSTALFDRKGRMLAQGVTLAIHLGSFPSAMKLLTEKYSKDARPGDVFIFNDPYGSGGMHLPDIYIIKPFFVDGVIEGYGGAIAHHSDVGGNAPGSHAIHSTEVYQEGLRLPTMKLYNEGVLNDSVFRIIEANTRMPNKLVGDIRAQIAACNSAERDYLHLISRYGKDAFIGYTEALQEYAERQMRAEIAELPDGVYTYTDRLDGLGKDPEPIVLNVTVTIAGDEIIIDWTGTSPQVKGAINAPVPATHSMSYMVVRSVTGADIPNCQGFMEPIKTIAPPGCVVNPTFPAACAARGVTVSRMVDTLLGAFAKAVPDRVPAAGEGGPSGIIVSGMHRDKAFVTIQTILGSWGGQDSCDGYEGVSPYAGNVSNEPIELSEAEFPIQIMQYGLVQNSGGAGRSRGGMAFVREVKLLAEEGAFNIRSDRRKFPPYGLNGGLVGSPSLNIYKTKNGHKILPVMPMEVAALKQGEAICHITASGGGFGDPLERSPEKVQEDARQERITIDYARDVYGVIIDANTMAIDEAATRRQRKELAKKPRQALQDSALRHFLHTVGVTASELAGTKEP